MSRLSTGQCDDRDATYRVKRTCAAGARPIGAPEGGNQLNGLDDLLRNWRRTRVARVGFAHDIGGQGTDGGNGDLVGGLRGELGHGW